MYGDVDSIPTYEDLAPGEPTYLLRGIVHKLGLPYEEASYIYDEADRYREPSKAYGKLLRLYLNFYLGTANEMYGRNWKTIYDAIDDRNTEMKKKLALRSFCFTFPMYWKCKGQSWENGAEEWEPDEHPTLTGGKRRTRKNKKITKRRKTNKKRKTNRRR
jgi:hypothetical protein